MFYRSGNDDFFPKMSGGFWADLITDTARLRLVAHLSGSKWGASVFNKRTKQWIAKSQSASSAEQARGMAEEIARSSLPPGSYDIEWQPVGSTT
jgi:hypothetical protein